MKYRFKVGEYVVAVKDLKNGFFTVPAGTMLRVTRRFNGYDLSGVVCSKCCMSVHITRVRESHLRPPAQGEMDGDR